jgi:hypothetical protein
MMRGENDKEKGKQQKGKEWNRTFLDWIVIDYKGVIEKVWLHKFIMPMKTIHCKNIYFDEQDREY